MTLIQQNKFQIEDKKKIVFFSNDLCKKPCLFTLEEQKAAYVIFSHLKSFKKNDTKLQISKQHFFNLLGITMSGEGMYERYAIIIKGLMNKSWFASEDEESCKQGIAIIFSDWKKFKDYFEIHLNPEFMPYLEALVSRYSQQELSYVTKFKSRYSLTLYRLFSSWLGKPGTKYCFFTTPQLRTLLTVPENAYIKTNHLEKNTITIAINEINKLTNLESQYCRNIKNGKVSGYKFTFDIAKTNCAEVELLDEKPKSLNQTAPSTESPYVEDVCPEPTHIKEDHNLDLQHLLDAEYSEFNAAGINQLKDFKYLRLYDAEIKQYWASIQKVLFSKHACGDGSHCLNEGDHYVIKRSEDKKLVLQKYICQKDKAKRFT